MIPPVFAQPTGGDIIVSDDVVGIIKVDPITGAQIVISPSGLNAFTGVTIDANGDIIASSIGAIFAIVRVDPTTGDQTTISSGGFFSDPAGIAIDANGDIIVANVGFPSAIIRVDPMTGAQTIISLFGPFPAAESPHGIAIAANGDIIVSDFNTGIITKVDPISGAQTTISFGGLLGAEVAGVRTDADGNIIVAGIDPNIVIKVNPTTGTQNLISSFGPDGAPNDIAIAANGDIIVTDPNLLAIIKVDPTSGAQTTISFEGLLQSNFWLTIYPSLFSDNDGISDLVDTEPGIFSNDFSDVSLGGVTTGTIMDRGGQTLTVVDDPDLTKGVRITTDASGEGLDPAVISSCGGTSTVRLAASVKVIISCGV